MQANDVTDRLFTLDRPCGGEERTLRIGDRTIRLAGLDRALAETLDARWGPFLDRSSAEPADLTLRTYAAGPDRFLARWKQGESYRIEAPSAAPRPMAFSYHFAVGAETEPRVWRVGITDDADESPGRLVENAVRFVCARLAGEVGGFAMHAAGVMRDGRAFLFAGPSGSGKTTVVGLAEPARSLGDDFAFVVPREKSWHTAAVPFDNTERIEEDPPRGFVPVAGIWRLYRAAETRVEQPDRGRAAASLMGCVAFPWALPDLAGRLLASVERFVGESRFGHLHFNRDEDFWTKLLPSL
jgi:hypothetical protein